MEYGQAAPGGRRQRRGCREGRDGESSSASQRPGLCCGELNGPSWRGVVRARWLLKYLGTGEYRDQE